MNEQKKQNQETKIDGVQAIYDYTHCKNVSSCAECECSKQINIEHFENLCEFLRTYTASARDRINSALNEVL